MKKRTVATTLMLVCAISLTPAIAPAQPDKVKTSASEQRKSSVKELTGRELFEAFYFGVGSGTDELSAALNDKHYDEFVKKVEEQGPVSDTEKAVHNVSDLVEQNDPGHFQKFKQRITSGDPFEFREQLGDTTKILAKIQETEMEKEGQTSNPGQVKPDAAVPIWAVALAVQWAGVGYQYGAVFNAAAYATVAVLTKGLFWDHTESQIDVDQMTAEIAPKLAK